MKFRTVKTVISGIFIFVMLLIISCSVQPEIYEDIVNEQDTNQLYSIGDDLNTNNENVSDPIEFATFEEIKYLALGDSYTIGQGVSEAERWPVQLSVELENAGFEVSSTDIIAQTGWTTANLINAINNADLPEYNLVSLLIGVNNQYQNLSFSLFETQFDSLLNMSIDIAGNSQKVFVVSIPDYGVTPFGSGNSDQIAEEIDMYNAYISDKCNDVNIAFINITEISRQLGDSPGALAPDNLHPSGSQYAAWVDEILPVVINLLQNKRQLF